MARRRNDDRPIGCVLIEGPLADIARRAPGGFCAALTSFGSAVTEEFRFSNYFSVSLKSIVEKCKVSIAFATSLGSDEICRLSWLIGKQPCSRPFGFDPCLMSVT